jgi:signal transduction histidine kinase
VGFGTPGFAAVVASPPGSAHSNRVPRRSWLDRYVLAVSAAGAVLLVFALTRIDIGRIGQAPVAFAVFALFVLVGEFVPIQLTQRDQVLELTTTTTFAVALSLQSGPAAAVLVLAAGSAAADLRQGKPLQKVVFNVAQYALSLGAAGVAYEWLRGGRPLGQSLLAAFVAAVAFFFLNFVLVTCAIALAQGEPVLRVLRREFAFSAWSSAMLLSIAPAAVLLAEENALLVATLALPVAAIYLAAKAAAAANERRSEAERAAGAARELAVEQGRLAQAEQAVVRELQEAARIKADLMASVSHELRSPLTTILGTIRTLSMREGQLDPEQRRELLEMASRQGDRLRELIEQLLQAAAPVPSAEPVATTEAPAQVDLAELAASAAAEARARHQGAAVMVRAAVALPVRAEADAVTRILANLIDNACKFSPAGTPVTVSTWAEEHLAVVAVTDRGPGIAPAERERVFGRFAPVADDHQGLRSGVGLGLYVARQLARNQGGELVLADGPAGTGSSFELRLPLAADGADQNDRPLRAWEAS